MNFLKLLVSALAIFSVNSVSLKDCGNSVTDQAKITGMGFSPENPVGGDQTEFWVAYDLKSELTGGTATYSVTLNYIPLTPTVKDLCSETSCPKAPGQYNETSNSTFPSGINGKIVTQIQWTNQNNQPVWCSKQTFSV